MVNLFRSGRGADPKSTDPGRAPMTLAGRSLIGTFLGNMANLPVCNMRLAC